MAALTLPADFACTQVQIGNAPPVTLSLWDAWQAYDAASAKHAEKGDERWPDVNADFAAWLKGQGLDVNPLVAEIVARHVFAEVVTLKKSDPSSPNAGSPSSTGSTVSTSEQTPTEAG